MPRTKIDLDYDVIADIIEEALERSDDEAALRLPTTRDIADVYNEREGTGHHRVTFKNHLTDLDRFEGVRVANYLAWRNRDG